MNSRWIIQDIKTRTRQAADSLLDPVGVEQIKFLISFFTNNKEDSYKKHIRNLINGIAEFEAHNHEEFLQQVRNQLSEIQHYCRVNPINTQLRALVDGFIWSIQQLVNVQPANHSVTRKITIERQHTLNAYVKTYKKIVKIKIYELSFAAFINEINFIKEIKPLLNPKKMHEAEINMTDGLYVINWPQYNSLRKKLSEIKANVIQTELTRENNMLTLEDVQKIFRKFKNAVDALYQPWFEGEYISLLKSFQKELADFNEENAAILKQPLFSQQATTEEKSSIPDTSTKIIANLAKRLDRLFMKWRNDVEPKCPRNVKYMDEYKAVRNVIDEYVDTLRNTSEELLQECRMLRNMIDASERNTHEQAYSLSAKERLQGEFNLLTRQYDKASKEKDALQTLLGSLHAIATSYEKNKHDAVALQQALANVVQPIAEDVKRLFDITTKPTVLDISGVREAPPSPTPSLRSVGEDETSVGVSNNVSQLRSQFTESTSPFNKHKRHSTSSPTTEHKQSSSIALRAFHSNKD